MVNVNLAFENLTKKNFFIREDKNAVVFTLGHLAKGILRYLGYHFETEEEACKTAVFERIADGDFCSETAATGRDIVTFLFNAFDYCPDSEEDRLSKVKGIIGINIFESPLSVSGAAIMVELILSYLKTEIFHNPTNRYRIHPMEHEISDDSNLIDPYLVQTGAGGAVINSVWKDGWNGNPENLKKLKNTALRLKKEKLHSWIYDEVVYPSGWAGGYVSDAKHRAQNIGVTYLYGNGKETVRAELPELGISFLSGFFAPVINGAADYTKRLEVKAEGENFNGTGIEGDWELSLFFIRKCNIWPYKWAKTIDPPIGPREHLNFLNADAVDTFIEGSLGRVNQYLGGMEDYFEAVFTDEPALQSIYIYGEKNKAAFESVPFGNELFSEFEKLNGYSLTLVLPYLFTDSGNEARLARLDFYKTIKTLMCRNFTGRYSKWCRDKGIHLSGHIHSEEGMHFHVGNYGDYMSVVGECDYPGFDMLCGSNSYFWQRGEGTNSCPHYLSGKFTSSATRIKGLNVTMTEICPVTPQDVFLKDVFNNFLAITTSAIFMGATHINLYGYRFLNDNRLFNLFNEYVGRLCYLLRNAKSDAGIAVYYPIESMQAAMYAPTTALDDLSDDCKKIQEYIENLTYYFNNNQIDFNFVTAKAVEEASVENGALTVKNISYSCVILPCCEVIPLTVLKNLEEFSKKGGKVIFLEKLPSLGMKKEEIPEVLRLTENKKAVSLGLSNLAFRAKVTASSTDVKNGYDPAYITNGSKECDFSFEGWSSETVPCELTVDLGESKCFNRMDLYSKTEHEQTEYKAYYETADGWKLFAEQDGNTYYHMISEFEPVMARKIKIIFQKGCRGDENIARLTELQLFYLRHSDKKDSFREELFDITGKTLEIKDAKADSMKVSRHCYDGKKLYFVLNSDDSDQTVLFQDKSAEVLTVYDPFSGEIKTFEGSATCKVTAGRAVFVEV